VEQDGDTIEMHGSRISWSSDIRKPKCAATTSNVFPNIPN